MIRWTASAAAQAAVCPVKVCPVMYVPCSPWMGAATRGVTRVAPNGM